jgi:short-subunit dehydrogenase
MKILITGSSRGIGYQLAKDLESKSHQVITVARSGDVTEQGNINDIEFRNYLVEKYIPDVFINNAGVARVDPSDIFSTNMNAAIDLLFKFYNTMPDGNIINIGSLAATMSGYGLKDFQTAAYIVSKKALHEASYILTEMATKPIKVTSLEIGSVATTLQNRFNNIEILESEYINQTLRTIPMKAEQVVDAVNYILNLPPNITMRSVELNNFVKPDGNNKSEHKKS